ncbi:hypothetical protein L1987_09317 [Smallanthus sonchifolius]|uniref:Uncharacterized protein n=1 Tax=Smallanthus sonchifolius TaxID=185202 RepID=A0ACB9JN42_9ASTR|nr:hypothetical protein L1987_09317 [Smallanthus sonchifolius]
MCVKTHLPDEEGQKSKWVNMYSGFAPLVAREYSGLVVDVHNWLTQRSNTHWEEIVGSSEKIQRRWDKQEDWRWLR